MLCVTVLCVTTRSLQTHPPTPTLAEEVPAGVEPVPPQQRKLGTRGTATTTRRSTTNDALVSRLRVVVVVKQSRTAPEKGRPCAPRAGAGRRRHYEMDVELGSVMTRAGQGSEDATRSTTTKKSLALWPCQHEEKAQRTTGGVKLLLAVSS